MYLQDNATKLKSIVGAWLFWALAGNHVKGNQSGCPDCAESGLIPVPAFYYIAITTDDEQTLYKIELPTYRLKSFPSADRARLRIVKLWNLIRKESCWSWEKNLTEFEPFKYRGPKVLVGAGNEELFTRDVLNLDRGTEAVLSLTFLYLVAGS